MKITIGIDLSIHSTGICVIKEEKEGKSIPSFFLILSDQKYSKVSVEKFHKYYTENSKKIKNNGIKVLFYEYSSPSKEPLGKEISKSLNVSNILDIIDKNILSPIFNKYKKSGNNLKSLIVNIESIALSASGTIDQLSGLNYGIRYLLLKKYGLPIENLGLITPTTLKKNSVGSGKAEKDIMVSSFKLLLSKDKNNKNNKNNKKLLENIEYFEKQLKWSIDDLADAYFLAINNL